jgi:dTDP-4-dehydrorhamnose reductase
MLKLSRERDELRVVDDEFVTPTPTVQIAEQLVALSRSTHYGLYHGTAEAVRGMSSPTRSSTLRAPEFAWKRCVQENFRQSGSFGCELVKPDADDPQAVQALVDRRIDLSIKSSWLTIQIAQPGATPMDWGTRYSQLMS